MLRRLSWFIAACLSFALADTSGAQDSAPKALALSNGPHLFVDDYLIAKNEGLERRVPQPKRTLPEPIVTGSTQHQNWQPFLTVIRDNALHAEQRFRMWYNVDVVDDPTDGRFSSKMGLLASADGRRWNGPYTLLESLPYEHRYRVGASVLDEGPPDTPAAERYKLIYFDGGSDAGPRIAFSPDGVKWNAYNFGKSVIPNSSLNDIWTAGWDPIRKRYYLIGKVLEPYAWTNLEGRALQETIRRYLIYFSSDFKNWSSPKTVFEPDERDPGITQWYGAAGFMVRGDLIIGFLRELRDDLSPEGAPQAAIDANTGGKAGLGAAALVADKGAGIGYTVLTWTRDGENWQRDRHTDKYLEPDPKVGAWDHAMAWVGSAVPVDDEVYLYYAGYRWGHKYHHSVDRQFGLVRVLRDRYVARRAGADVGQLTTPVVTFDGGALTINADATTGSLRVQVCDAAGKPIPGLTYADCEPIKGDSLDAPVKWKSKSLADIAGQPVQLQFEIKNASLFAFELAK